MFQPPPREESEVNQASEGQQGAQSQPCRNPLQTTLFGGHVNTAQGFHSLQGRSSSSLSLLSGLLTGTVLCLGKRETMESIIGTDVLSSWQSPHSSSLTYEVRVIMLTMAKGKPLKLTKFPSSSLTKSVTRSTVQEKVKRLAPSSKV